MPIEAQPDVARERSLLTQMTPDTDPQAIPTRKYKTMAAHPPAPALWQPDKNTSIGNSNLEFVPVSGLILESSGEIGNNYWNICV